MVGGVAYSLYEFFHHPDPPKFQAPESKHSNATSPSSKLASWIVVPSQICSIILGRITIIGQQRQFVVRINQAFCSIYIQIVSFHILNEVVGAPTPLCRRSVNNL